MQKEDRLGPETELTRSTPVLMMGIRETPTTTAPVMNWGPESSSEKGTSTDDSVCSLMSFPNGNVQKVHETPERLYVYRGSVPGEANDRSEEEITDSKHEPTGETRSKAS